MHELFFAVTLGEERTSFPFRGGFLNTTVVCNESNFIRYIENGSSFLIWKSWNLADLAEEVFQHLMSQTEITAETLSHISGTFNFVFFNGDLELLVFGKDRLGLSSLIFSETPFCVATHDIDGEEHPPGFTVFTRDSQARIELPKYERTERDVTVEEAMAKLTEILTRKVRPGCPVLFSGGLDSTLIAGCLGAAGAPVVDLINFCATENAPDRISSQKSLTDLKAAFPATDFRLHEYTGNLEEMAMKLAEIRGLLKPLAVTEMNLNIAMTLYSALSKADQCAVHSGLGADELFCGYMRMREEESAQEEITDHVNRIWGRNGGRDDRVAMHVGKQCICPFLDPEILEYAMSLPSTMLIKTKLKRGEGEKWILRQIALKMGLNEAGMRPKQAMQFGSKVAKADWRGSDAIPQS